MNHFEKKINPKAVDTILKELREIIKVNENGLLSYNSIAFKNYEWLLYSFSKFGDIQNVDLRKQLLKKALTSIIKLDKCNASDFQKELDNQVRHYKRQKESSYHILTTLSISKLPFRKIQIGESNILFYKRKYPAELAAERAKIFEYSRLEKEKNDFVKTEIIVKAKSDHEAYSKGIQDFEVLRGFLNLLLNHSLQINFGKQKAKPINRILKNEIETIHGPNIGMPQDNSFWYDEDPTTTSCVNIDESKYKKIKKELTWLIRRFNSCKPRHKNELRIALNIYVDAFDQKNKHNCFLKAWSALERLLNAYKKEHILPRSVALFDSESKPYQEIMITSLNEYRNEYVHQGKSGHDPYIACYMIHRIIFNFIIRLHLGYSGFFEDIIEANYFLDSYGTELHKLVKRRSILDKAIKRKSKNIKT